MEELEWSDYLDEETGIFRYYGNSRELGRELTDTKKHGNKILELVFGLLNEGKRLEDISPFFVFKKTENGRDIQFLGCAAPGNSKISPDKDLVAFWRTVKEKIFRNYEAYFTILNTGEKPITKQWINALIYEHKNSWQYAPRIFKSPSKYDQLQSDVEGNRCLEIIRTHYKDNPYGFEACATNIISKMDSNFVDYSLTRPWRDGGRDAIGYYFISTGGKVNSPLKIDCALEAKSYSADTAARVRQMSRLISRIRYRQFGVMITTSYVDGQAYKKAVEDGPLILIVTAFDIAGILRNNAIDSSNIDDWFRTIDHSTNQLEAYYHRLNEVLWN